MALPILKNHVTEGEDLLMSQWENSPNIQGLLKSYVENLQLVEVALFQLLNERGLYTAIGEQLDVLGRILGESRKSRGDISYRVALVGRATANNSDGSTEDVMGTLRAVTGANNITFFEHYPASVHYYADSGVGNGIVEALDRASSAGVSTRVLYDLQQTMFLASEFTVIFDTVLVNELLDHIQVIDADSNLYDIGLGTFGATEAEARSIFPEFEGVHTQLLINPDFSSGLDDWVTVSGTPTTTSGVLEVAAGDTISQAITTVVGETYTAMLGAGDTAGTFVIAIGNTQGGSEVTTFTTEVVDKVEVVVMLPFVATSTTTHITIKDTASTSQISSLNVGTLWENNPLSGGTLLNPLCDVLDATSYDVDYGNIVDDLGNNVINDLAENIKYLN